MERVTISEALKQVPCSRSWIETAIRREGLGVFNAVKENGSVCKVDPKAIRARVDAERQKGSRFGPIGTRHGPSQRVSPDGRLRKLPAVHPWRWHFGGRQFAKALYDVLVAREWSQADLATKMGLRPEAGHVSAWLGGQLPRTRTLEKLADLTNGFSTKPAAPVDPVAAITGLGDIGPRRVVGNYDHHAPGGVHYEGIGDELALSVTPTSEASSFLQVANRHLAEKRSAAAFANSSRATAYAWLTDFAKRHLGRALIPSEIADGVIPHVNAGNGIELRPHVRVPGDDNLPPKVVTVDAIINCPVCNEALTKTFNATVALNGKADTFYVEVAILHEQAEAHRAKHPAGKEALAY
jgi:transcriptional regulator with XRE-family HTH domain